MKKCVLICMILLLLCGCSDKRYYDNEIYTVQQDTSQTDSIVGWLDVEGKNDFYKKAIYGEDGELVVSAVGDFYYYMTPSQEAYNGPVLLKGDAGCHLDLYEVDTKTNDKNLIVTNVGFIHKVTWNHNHSLLGILADDELILYDKAHQTVSKVAIDGDIVDFYWSPIDHDKLYLEQNNAYSGYIYYVNGQKTLALYESKERLYYRDYLDKGLYYANQLVPGDNDQTKDKLLTVLVNEEGEVTKVIGNGRYKDSYLKHVLLTGDHGFGLYYIDDVNYPERVITLSNEYIYYASFIADGSILYMVGNSEEKDEYKLILSDGSGNIMMEEYTASWGIILTADGNFALNGKKMLNCYDLSSGAVVQQFSAVVDDRFDDEMVTWLRDVAILYAKEQLGVEIDKQKLQNNFVVNDVAVMAKEEYADRKKVEKYMIKADCNLNTQGDTIVCEMHMMGIGNNGLQQQETVTWFIQNEESQWKIQGTMK